MQKLAIIDVVSRGIRVKVCPQCYQRPAASENWGPLHPRACEGTCTIFQNLPRLVGISSFVQDPKLGAYEDAVLTHVCGHCSVPTAGEFCVAHASRTCPLSRYLSDVLDVLNKIPHHQQSCTKLKQV
jgi:hypothetical protein